MTMKTKIIALLAMLLGVTNMYAQEHKILIAYFSWSGNTQHVAEYIARQTDGTLFRIEPVKPYPRRKRTTPVPPSRTRWRIGTATIRCSSAAPYGGGLPR